MKQFKEKLFDEYKYKIELHAHTTPVSACSEIPCEVLAGKFIELGYDGVVITNHMQPGFLDMFKSAADCAEYYVNDFLNTKKAAGDKLSVCLGMEIRFTENWNDYLVYGINENDIEKAFCFLDKGIKAFYKEFKNDKNIILQAHPFRDNMERANPADIDGIEVFNFHAEHNPRMSEAAKFAKENNLIVSGGVDLHHDFQWGTHTVRCKNVPKDSYEVAELIKSGEMLFQVGNSIVLP